MPKLNQIVLINAAGFDYVEFPVGQPTQVIGTNGHGKSTLLRTVLFFYLGSNDKAPMGLHETKEDFVSHYLGQPPSYLIYEVARGDGEPNFHVAVTRPAGRIQFHFIDAPYSKSFYVDGKFVQPIASVEERLLNAQCPNETVYSYDEYIQRIYGIVPSPYEVFRPAPRSSGQVGILARIISGIFTVSQLNADKLKSALTCGVKDETHTNLDLLQLKNQLENFHRVNRAVRLFLKYENDAIQLLFIGDEFKNARDARQRALESLVRMAKCLPGEMERVTSEQAQIKKTRAEAIAAFESQTDSLNAVISEIGNLIAVLQGQIGDGEQVEREYRENKIDVKERELVTLPELEKEKRLVEAEYNLLTEKYQAENSRKQQLLAELKEGLSKALIALQKRRTDLQEQLGKSLEEASTDQQASLRAIDQQSQEEMGAIAVRKRKAEADRADVNRRFREISEMKEPAELIDTRRNLAEKTRKAEEARFQQEKLRAEVEKCQISAGAAQEKLERDAESLQKAIKLEIEQLGRERERLEREIQAYEASLASFFQKENPAGWPHAEKALNRETLFRNAAELGARKCEDSDQRSAWGVEFDSNSLPAPAESFDLEKLSEKLKLTVISLKDAHDRDEGARQRYLSDVAELAKQTGQARKKLEADQLAAKERRSALLQEIALLESRTQELEESFKQAKSSRLETVSKQDALLAIEEENIRRGEQEVLERSSSKKLKVEADFQSRKAALKRDAEERAGAISAEEKKAHANHAADVTRVETAFQQELAAPGMNPKLIAGARLKLEKAGQEIERISAYSTIVAKYKTLHEASVAPLPRRRLELAQNAEAQRSKVRARSELKQKHDAVIAELNTRSSELNGIESELAADLGAYNAFREDFRFSQEWGYPAREDLPPEPFFKRTIIQSLWKSAQESHHQREELAKRGEKEARTFLGRFDEETLKRKVLGFSPPDEHFNWFLFVGGELEPFVNARSIEGMKQIQTQEFQQLVRNICRKNADFCEGIRRVNHTAQSVQERVAQNNFVDVIDSVELKVERIDSSLTRVLAKIEEFADVNFGAVGDLFAKRADREQVDKAIETFARLVKEIDDHKAKVLQLTDYFDFSIRVHENGRDMGWRKSLDDIGSKGTDYLVKMLFYLSLIEVFRERAIDSRRGATVHCILDETGVLAPKYIRCVLEYADRKGIILVTAGHSQQTVGFTNWMLVRKHGNRFRGQVALRKVLQCD